ncbi:MAG: hypothetical protein M1823_003972 [Watsoniomyces obsoletus]|nr:MAG: hypothetical protein M1823_003972 [Watsoniomyces obsoletus]
MATITNPLQRRLSKIYSDTKKSYDTVTEPPKTADVTPELTSLYRKLRIQKDRLIAWGVEWSDTTAAQPGDIDESLERAGYGDVVGSVMSTIKEILHEAEQMRYTDPMVTNVGLGAGYVAEVKSSGLVTDRKQAMDRVQFEDLLQQLTTSIDSLYRFSAQRSHSTQARKRLKSDPTHGWNTPQPSLESLLLAPPSSASGDKAAIAMGSTGQRGGVGALLQLDRSMLEIDPEGPSSKPPPYEPVPTPSNARTLGRLRQLASAHHPWSQDAGRTVNIPVFIDYAPFDPIYLDTGISPPKERMEQLAEALNRPDGVAADPKLRVLNLIGYFEDLDRHRFGLVYELPESVCSAPLHRLTRPSDIIRPVTLFSALNADAVADVSHVPYLEHRVRLAYGLAATFSRLHTKGLVHRDVTSNHVIFFRPRSARHLAAPEARLTHELRRPYLCSFDVFSDTNVEVKTRGHIYRHPLDRGDGQGAKHVFRPSFDVYGLGLILLEIGLWMPLSSFWKPHYDLQTFKSRLQKNYAPKLGAKCGSLYMRAVESCLSAADRELEATRIGKKWDAQWTLHCEAVQLLEQLCAMDDGEPPELVPGSAPPPAAELSLPSPPPTISSRMASPETSAILNCTPQPPPLRREPSSQVSDTTVTPSLRDSPPVQGTTTPMASQINLTRKPALKVFQVEMEPEDLRLWEGVMLVQLARLMSKVLKDPRESFAVDLVNMGETAETARPTILVTCTSVQLVKDFLRRRFRFDRSKFTLRVRTGRIRRSFARRGPATNKKKRKLKRSCRSAAVQASGDDPTPINTQHQQRPICGASIGVYRNDEHLSAVSLGGVIVVDGEHYGMTVHHLLDPPTDSEEMEEDSHDGVQESDYDEDEEHSDDDDYLAPSRAHLASSDSLHAADTRRISRSLRTSKQDISFDEFDDEVGSPFEDYDASDEEEEDMSSVRDIGDKPGVKAGQGEELGLRVTQPAFDDVDPNFFPNEEDSHEEHLYSHAFGWVHASSGLRRVERESDPMPHEIDWALLKVDEERLQPHNLVQGGRRYCPSGNPRPAGNLREPVYRHPDFAADEDLYPTEVAPMSELGDLAVHCVGRTSGLRNGVISKTMGLLRVHGRRDPSISWHVKGGFGVGGDSGAWVIDDKRGRVCGHILAWCTRNEWAYICPMELTLEDIKRTLSAREIILPDAIQENLPPLGNTPIEERVDVAMEEPSTHDGDKLVELVQPMSELQFVGSSEPLSSSSPTTSPSMSSASASTTKTTPSVAERSRLMSVAVS